MPDYSIIIPTLNEEENISNLLQHLKGFNADAEIIISDGGSSDKTLQIAGKYDVKTCISSPNRGRQLNEGTKIALGKVLIYLHADTFLPSNAFYLIEELFENPYAKAATFRLSFDSSNSLLKLYCYFTKHDSMFTTFGDQAIILKRELLEETNGFPDIKIFEDVEFLRRLRKHTKIYKLPARVITSGRRFYKKGIILTQLLNVYYFILYLMKVNPDKIYRKYFND